MSFPKKPLILAPAGNLKALLSAVAAGADAIYCGLKNFSARMEADNFSISELARISIFLKQKNIKLYIALNSILKHSDLTSAFNLLFNLQEEVKPDAIIINDLAFIEIAKQVGFKGEIHLSTLSNFSFPKAFQTAKLLNISKIVLPREFTIDEIKNIAKESPIKLEVFINGALCYGVSGRCYWSSFLGGKSALRGRCVQPCRRLYTQNSEQKRFFSCRDLSIDVLTKLLLPIKEVDTWKIEGRKKGGNYVYYTVKAYKLLRDNPADSKIKKEALNYLNLALGRETTHYNFLSHRRYSPIDTTKETASGRLIGIVKDNTFIAREPVFRDDIIRIGYEDNKKGIPIKIMRDMPKQGKLKLKERVKKNTKVFLIDRNDKELKNALTKEMNEFSVINYKREKKTTPTLKVPLKNIKKRKIVDIIANDSFFLPPIVWDEKELKEQIAKRIRAGQTFFILNSPWQISLFKSYKNLSLWAGPFCNITNNLAVKSMAELGFDGVIVSPELSKNDYIDIANKNFLPLGILIYGSFPLSISRTLSEEIKLNKSFLSPKKEESIVKKKGENYFVYPNWHLDLRSKKDFLIKNGYSLFLTMNEKFPANFKIKQRKSVWNWDIRLF